jgi:hypothetical protein
MACLIGNGSIQKFKKMSKWNWPTYRPNSANEAFKDIVTWIYQNGPDHSVRNRWRSYFCAQFLAPGEGVGSCESQPWFEAFEASDGLMTSHILQSLSCPISDCGYKPSPKHILKVVNLPDSLVDRERTLLVASASNDRCPYCTEFFLIDSQLLEAPLVLTIQLRLVKPRITTSLRYNNLQYQLCGVMWGDTRHFVATFQINNLWYSYDDLRPQISECDGPRFPQDVYQVVDTLFYSRQ